eukprot:CAMPEP_0201164702 /NCGR_PEP_ID=MMETSP0851-20130426/61408_1 /ASSEMBLY_ACC=CAM_ASM_000631 /TAXON_ID=183588 /ORGANISM="Pseudo-nitzschia fraudulenta, Strain WWA7" /LENGTH=197 /DNA_ID=CAMNT_0047445195 /DNA_START=160 /DNA_END=753 /DNA_ORIENTATION=+
MESDSTSDVLSQAGLLLQNGKATSEMQRSIAKFAKLLICPLCNKIFDRPATLSACAHTFCMNCIDAYSCNHSTCPVKGCGMPISIVGGNGGSFRKLNLQISQTIESLQLICRSLNRSKENWWLSPATLESIEQMKSSKTEDDEDDECSRRENDGEDDADEEMIDLQANEEESSCLLLSNENDERDTDANTSDDETVY